MKTANIKSVFAMGAIALAMLSACSEDDNDPKGGNPAVENDFHIAFASGTGANSATYVQGVSDLSTGVINSTTGFELESSRTARIFASADGSYLYSLNYTVGTVEKLQYLGGDRYTRVARIDASVPLGVKALRFSHLNDQLASLHYINATPLYDEVDETAYLRHKMVLSIGLLDLEKMRMVDGYKASLEVELDEELAAQGYFISRIDAPVLSGSKLYYGAAVRKWDATKGEAADVNKTFTLVLDYPTLSNPKIIAAYDDFGATNGYRTSTQYVDEEGDILQLTSGNEEVHILKIRNGEYVEYDFDLSEKLGKPANSNGWFYAGNGIGYVPYEDLSKDKVQVGVNPQGEPTYSAMWKLARVDLVNGTVVDLNVPDNLWLTQYQASAVRDGIFYIALSPIGVDGNIYMFDVDSESPDGQTGARLAGTGADQYYIGIY
jgi:hypothetical protein